MNQAGKEPPSVNRQGAWRARLGVIVPSVNTVVEPSFSAACPPGVAVYASRMLVGEVLTPDAIIRMDQVEGRAAVQSIATCRPHAVAYCCTASSIVQGLEYDLELQQEIAKTAGVPATTATQSILHALRVLNVRRIAIASPYTETIEHAEQVFFESAGLEVVSSVCLGIEGAFNLADPTPDEIYELAMRAFRPDAEAILIPCLNMWSQTVIERLEQETRVPVVTSTQAMLWRLLRIAGIEDRIPGYGRLLAEH
jgi:maleate isomerase